MGLISSIRKNKIGHKSRSSVHTNKVLLNGKSVWRGRRITICSTCAKSSVCKHTHSTRLCTTAGQLYDAKQEYKHKFMGNYLFIRYLKKESKSNL